MGVINETFPEKYDLRDYGLVSPIRDQGKIGDCWAFATMAALEYTAKKQFEVDYDFSEINMASNNGITTPDNGGNDYIAASYLTSWNGPVLEKDDPNPTIIEEIKSNVAIRSQFHVQEVLFLPTRENPIDNSDIKRALMKYGVVTASICYRSPFYSIAHKSFYNNQTRDVNHEIAIVGWDDNYPKENFYRAAPVNGAFIARNSYGTSFGDNGYFYISYYDKTIGNYNTAYSELELTENYGNAYLSKDTFNVHSGKDVLRTSVFNAIALNEEIIAVSIFTFKKEMAYEIYLESDYIEYNVRNILKEKLPKIEDVYFEEAGFHTVKLDVAMSRLNKPFAIIFKEKSPQDNKFKRGLALNEKDAPQRIFKGMIYTTNI